MQKVSVVTSQKNTLEMLRTKNALTASVYVHCFIKNSVNLVYFTLSVFSVKAKGKQRQ